jgi:hypothetical protein
MYSNHAVSWKMYEAYSCSALTSSHRERQRKWSASFSPEKLGAISDSTQSAAPPRSAARSCCCTAAVVKSPCSYARASRTANDQLKLSKTVRADEFVSTTATQGAVTICNIQELTCSSTASPTPSIGSKSTPTSCPVSPIILCATKLQPPGAAPKSTTLKPGFSMRCFVCSSCEIGISAMGSFNKWQEVT